MIWRKFVLYLGCATTQVLLSVCASLAAVSDENYEQGKNLLDKREYAQAIVALTKAISENGKNADAFAQRAKAYTHVWKDQEAIVDANRAVSLAPKSALALQARSVVDSMIGEYQKAVADATCAIELEPKFAQAYVSRGTAEETSDSFKSAWTMQIKPLH